MIKLFFKGIIFVMGIQSLFGKLQNEGIIKGSIEINYPVLQEKIISIIKSDEFNGLIKKLNESNVNSYSVYEEVQVKEVSNKTCDTDSRLRWFKHVVREGETLTNLADFYGVSWKVIKKINRISDDRLLQVGQPIIIPNIMQALG